MKLHEQERDLFAKFGDREISEIDLTMVDAPSNENEIITESLEQEVESEQVLGLELEAANAPSALAPEPQSAEPRTSEIPEFDIREFEISESETPKTKTPKTKTKPAQSRAAPATENFNPGFSWAAFSGGLASLVWIGGAIGAPIAYYGADAVLAMDPTLQAGLIALAFGPAVLFWLGGAAAGDAFKARKLAHEITRIARGAANPFVSTEDQAKRLSEAVKHEIETLNFAVTAAMGRLGEFRAAAETNAAIFDDAVSASREHADHLTSNLARERDAIVEISGEMRGQTETISHSIGRQVRLMREASKLVKTELGAAEDALEGHLASFAASAQIMAERTHAFHGVAESAQTASASLNTTLTDMLDGLGQATHLTDAARQSAEQAKVAANETASAVRETTQRAVAEAKRAAQLIRAETAAMQEVAGETLARLQSAADAARAASAESQAAADRHAASIERRLSALAATASAQPRAPHQPEAQAPRVVETARTAAMAKLDAVERNSSEEQFEQRQPMRAASGAKTWSSNLFGQPTQKRDAPRGEQFDDGLELIAFGAPTIVKTVDPDTQLKQDVLDLVAAAGIDINAILSAADLEHVAQSSRHGAAARRQAVIDCAPVSVNRILRHVKRNAAASETAAQFRARPDLTRGQRKGEASELVRAYLLIDAALD
jgi:hypothetical protein